MTGEHNKLKRKRHPMPDYIRQAMEDSGVMQEYLERPAYQRNDYIGWIERAKRQETRERRLQQMLNELREGGLYMKMSHPPSARK